MLNINFHFSALKIGLYVVTQMEQWTYASSNEPQSFFVIAKKSDVYH